MMLLIMVRFRWWNLFRSVVVVVGMISIDRFVVLLDCEGVMIMIVIVLIMLVMNYIVMERGWEWMLSSLVVVGCFERVCSCVLIFVWCRMICMRMVVMIVIVMVVMVIWLMMMLFRENVGLVMIGVNGCGLFLNRMNDIEISSSSGLMVMVDCVVVEVLESYVVVMNLIVVVRSFVIRMLRMELS